MEERSRSENTSLNTIGATDFEAWLSKPGRLGDLSGSAFSSDQPGVEFYGAFLEFDIAEREEWYSQNTSPTSVLKAQHSQFNAQKPKFSVRWQPFDPKWIGALTYSGSYTEAFHAPTYPDLDASRNQSFGRIRDPRGLTPNDDRV